MRFYRFIALAMVLFSCISCSLLHRQPRVFVPALPTARDQFVLAQRKESDRMIVDKRTAKYKIATRELISCYDQVASRFPDDRTYTPWARIRLAQLHMEQGEYRLAMRMDEAVLKDYGDLKAPDAQARYLKGVIYERMGKKTQAQEAYRDCMEHYKDSDDQEAKNTAAKCQALYDRVFTVGEKSKRK